MKQEKRTIVNNYKHGNIMLLRNVLLLCFFSLNLNAQLTPQEMVIKMGRGLNLGNVLSAPVEGNWSGAATEEYFQDVSDAGFKNVRIPIDFYGSRTSGSTANYSKEPNTSSNYNGSMGDYVVSSTYLDRVEQVINWGLSNNLVIILDFHGAELKSEFIFTFDSDDNNYTNPTSAKRSADLDKFFSIWKQIAERFKNYSDDLIFDVINEPYFHMSDTEMDYLNSQVINIIRSTGELNETRKISITGGTRASYRAPTAISREILESDDYLIATFHYYRPFSFTKSEVFRFNDNSWGTDNDKSTLDQEFDTVLAWANSFNPPVAVYLGEFSASNYSGYSYQTGDLHIVNENNPSSTYPQGTGYSDGGPDPQSRVDYHGYIADAAISRGFSFSAWCGGGESTKTVHLRKDSGLVTYDFDYFTVTSFVPKITSPSTVVEQSKWVDDVRDALLYGYQGVTCNDSDIVKNLDFECGFDNNWTLQTVGSVAAANYENALDNSRTGSSGGKISVSQSDAYNRVVLRNAIIDDSSFFDGKTIDVKFYAKTNNGGNKIKIRFKHFTSNGYQYTPSEAIELTNQYPNEPYEYEFVVPDNTSNLQLQVLFGQFTGEYFIDDFTVDVTNTLSSDEIKQNKISYIVNDNNLILMNNSSDINFVKIFDINGKLLHKSKKKVIPLKILDNNPNLIQVNTNNIVHTFKFIKPN